MFQSFYFVNGHRLYFIQFLVYSTCTIRGPIKIYRGNSFLSCLFSNQYNSQYIPFTNLAGLQNNIHRRTTSPHRHPTNYTTTRIWAQQIFNTTTQTRFNHSNPISKYINTTECQVLAAPPSRRGITLQDLSPVSPFSFKKFIKQINKFHSGVVCTIRLVK